MMWRYFNITHLTIIYLLGSYAQASDIRENLKEEEQSPSLSISSSHAQLPPLVSDYDNQGSSTSGSSNVEAEVQGTFISTASQVPIIKFKHFDYDPNTQTFQGGFFDEAGHIINQILGYYVGKKYDETFSNMKADLLAMRASLDENKPKKSIKGKEKDEGSGSDLESYERRKQQKGEILLKEAELEHYQHKAIKYQQLINVLNQPEQTLQQLFYVEMFIAVHEAKYSGHTSLINFNSIWQDPLHSESLPGFFVNNLHSAFIQAPDESGFHKATTMDEELKKERKNEIKLQDLEKSLESFKAYLHSYAILQMQSRSHDLRIVRLEDFKRMKTICSNPKFSKNETLQELAATFLEASKEEAIRKLKNLKEREENEFRPLAAFYHQFIEILSGFQSEVKLKGMKRT